MSLNSALNAAVSGLRAQSTAVAAVSENIANASTTAYKLRQVSFKSLVTGSSSARFSGGGVVYDTSQNLRQQGQVQATDTNTNLALNGNGFFVVTDQLTNQPSGFTYTRNGTFKTDSSGYLINDEGYYLLGQRTDDKGVVVSTSANDLNSLSPIDANTISGTAQATSNIRFDMNLPADATVGSTFSNSFEVFDALGVSHTVSVSWLKNAANNWTATLSDPVKTGTTAPISGVIDTDPATAGAQKTINLTFNGNGSIASFVPATPGFDITGFTSGANNSSVTLDWGTVGNTDGVTQFSSNTTVPGLEVYLIDQDGVRFGQLSDVTVDSTGLVTASFENGVRLPIYQIPVATFPNPDGLTHVEGTVYDENENAGNFNLRLPGQGNAGNIVSSALEQSTTDTSEEFNKMIVAQQAYSSAAQVVKTVDNMFQDLIAAVR